MQWMVKVVSHFWQSVQVLLMSILGKLFKHSCQYYIVILLPDPVKACKNEHYSAHRSHVSFAALEQYVCHPII